MNCKIIIIRLDVINKKQRTIVLVYKAYVEVRFLDNNFIYDATVITQFPRTKHQGSKSVTKSSPLLGNFL